MQGGAPGSAPRLHLQRPLMPGTEPPRPVLSERGTPEPVLRRPPGFHPRLGYTDPLPAPRSRPGPPHMSVS